MTNLLLSPAITMLWYVRTWREHREDVLDSPAQGCWQSFALHLWFNAELVWGNANPGNVCCGDRAMGMKMRSPLVCILRWTNRRLNQLITALTLTGQTVDHRRLLLLLFFVWCCTVFSVHLADRGGALSLDLGVKFLVKENLVDQVWLDRTGLCRGLGGPIVISWMMRYKKSKWICFM